MPVDIVLENGTRATINARQHQWHADEPADAGGADSAPTPGEMMLGALGSCMAITCRLYAERKGWDLQRVEVTLDYERFKGGDYPAHEGSDAFVHEVREALVFHGDLDDKQRRRLRDIAGKCPIHRLLEYPAYFVELALAEE
ncbi:MAG: OsmC family protein [Chloroflexota bacterium]|nr:OsmC family protein [Chloroflexota bacterium]MDE2907696.1 OsmC family protein [Chloroflexota bacterium]